MDTDYYYLQKLANKAKEARKQRAQEFAHKQLEKDIAKKIRTVFIGAIASIEDNFGFLWGHNKNSSELTQKELDMRSVFEQLRTDILNKGNTQLRSAQNDLINYQIEKRKHHIDIPIIDKE